MPPTVQINVGGQTVIIPGVYVSTSVTPVVPSGLLPTGPLVFVAFSYGGVPLLLLTLLALKDCKLL